MNDVMDRPDVVEERLFRANYAKSFNAVWAVARRIHRQGELEVRISPFHLRPTFAEREAYGDAGDILVRRMGRDDWERVEVKGRSLDFTCLDDFPYPSFFLERVNHLEKFDPAYAYFMANRALTRAAVVMGSTRPKWIGPTTFFDRTYGREANAYECPAELALWVSLQTPEGRQEEMMQFAREALN
jgi:hypothetical protein